MPMTLINKIKKEYNGKLIQYKKDVYSQPYVMIDGSYKKRRKVENKMIFFVLNTDHVSIGQDENYITFKVLTLDGDIGMLSLLESEFIVL